MALDSAASISDALTAQASRPRLRPVSEGTAAARRFNWYRVKTSFIGMKRLATLPQEDKEACIDAYHFFQRMQSGEETATEDEKAKLADLNWRIVAEKRR